MIATLASTPSRRGRQLLPQLSDEKAELPPNKRRLSEPQASTEKVEESNPLLKWFGENMESIAEADRIIGVQLANRKHVCQHTSSDMHKLCDEVFNNVLQIGPHGSENNSVLLLGEAGSGKTHIVEWCIKELHRQRPNTLVLRARGSAYSTDVECLRHLGTQMTDRLESVPHANASFKEGIDWIKGVFSTSFKQASAMVMVLDQFEYFCSRSRQTLLYNLFDIAQEAGMHLSVIGTSEKMDVMDSLEKRIRSRFSMRHLHTVLPTTMDGLVQVLAARMKLPNKCGLKASFVTQFTKHLETALFAKLREWKPHLELGRPPSWFLARCVPVGKFLHEAFLSEPTGSSSASAPPAKRLRGGTSCWASVTNREATMLLLDSLTEDDHIVLLALYRLNARKQPRTLSSILFEISLYHENGKGILHGYNPDLYIDSFDRLLRMRLIELARPSTADAAKRHVPCASCVDRIYAELVCELGAKTAGAIRNPLRSLPLPVQQWASIQRN